MTTHEAATELDVLPARICTLLRQKVLKGKKVDGKWTVFGGSVRKEIWRRLKAAKAER
jgi:hypothetical protein